MRHQLELAYLGIEVADPAALDATFGEIVGLQPAEAPTGGGRAWRNDDRVRRVIVEPGETGDATYLGVEAVDDDAFDSTVTRLGAAGFEVADGDAARCRLRGVDRLARARAPWGVDVELVTALARAPDPFDSPGAPGGFLTDGVGFGHVVFATTEFDESQRFLVDGLGFAQSDWLQTAIAEGIELEVRFFHCNARHHSVALARAPFQLPQTMHHVMFEMRRRDDVGAAFDRAWESGLDIPNGLGRHDNDGMFSFYFASPVGFQVEVGHGARTITDGWDDNRRYDRISAWGHQPLRQS